MDSQQFLHYLNTLEDIYVYIAWLRDFKGSIEVYTRTLTLSIYWLREAARNKVVFLMTGPLRPNPPPLELNGRWNVGTLEKRFKKKLFFPLWPGPLAPPPGPAIKRRTFFAASLICPHNVLKSFAVQVDFQSKFAHFLKIHLSVLKSRSLKVNMINCINI